MSLRRKKTTPFYQQPWFGPAMGWGGVALLFLVLHVLWPASILAWMVDILSFATVFAVAMGLISQFVLPVATFEERSAAYSRLWSYWGGQHGPIVFVRNGEMVAAQNELKRQGPGVVLNDAASAVVLERRQKFKRAVGPGITFLEIGETIKETIDLRPQWRDTRTRALTRDGIEIETTLSVVFGLAGSGSTSQHSPVSADDDAEALFLSARARSAYVFDPQAAFRAVYGLAVDTNKIVNWDDLPAMIVAEAFRDVLARLTLDQIFERGNPESHPVEFLTSRLLREVQRSNLMHERGIQIHSVQVGYIALPDTVEDQLLSTWRADWERAAMSTRTEGKEAVEGLMEQARADAQAEMIGSLQRSINVAFSDGGRLSQQEVARKLLDMLGRAASDPTARLFLSNSALSHFQSMREWAGLDEDPLPSITPDPPSSPGGDGSPPSSAITPLDGTVTP